jgi:hypothetical protein
VPGPRNLEGHHPGAEGLGRLPGPGHQFPGPGNHRLLRGVEIGQGQGAFSQERFQGIGQLVRGQPDDRGHGAGMALRFPLHEAAPLPDRFQGVAGAQHPAANRALNSPRLWPQTAAGVAPALVRA